MVVLTAVAAVHQLQDRRDNIFSNSFIQQQIINTSVLYCSNIAISQRNSMKKIFAFFFGSTVFCNLSFAQQPDDALKFGWFTPNGTARNLSIGGAMASLGGDITSNHINPAGIGLYKTREFVFSPGINLNNNKINFLDTKSTQTRSAFAYGTGGIIFGSPSRYKGPVASTAFAISVTQLASYNNHTYYKGNNSYSSYSEKYVEELVRDGANEDAALKNYVFGSSLAYYTYLVDTTLDANNQLSGYRSLVPVGTGIQQERDEDTKGGLHELAFAFAGNMADRLYLGIGLNIPILGYTRNLTYTETDISGNTNNNFAFFTYKENYKTNGIGLNAKLGLIYKLNNSIRLGFAFHTPSIMQLTDKQRTEITTNTEAYAGEIKATSDEFNSGNAGEITYRVTTPYRVIGSISFLLSPVEETKKQRGFITADLEYVNYRGVRYNVLPENEGDQIGVDYYKALNDVIKDYYQGNINVRVGGEIKFDPWAVRLGGAYYGSPYADKELKANRIMASGGIGYRNRGFFIDLTLSETFNTDVNFPYRLNDKANVFAETKNNRANIVATAGFKF